ncbi:MAG: hypothetical protein JNM17_36905 [Archangium sp.]|nr:hypothetical protein [Archangium sp.]
MRRLVRAPVASLLREVTLFPGDEPWSRSIEELSALPHPEVLSSLKLDASQLDLADGEWDAGDFGELWHCFPSLRELFISGTSIALGNIGALSQLRTFSRVGCAPSGDELEQLASLQRLEALELGFRPPARGDELRLFPSVLVAPMKKALKLPLRALCLRDVELTTQLLATLFESPAFRTLRTLDLGDCEVDDECAEYLRDEKAALAKLEHVSSPTFPLEEFGDRFDDDGFRNRGEAVLRGKNLVDDAWSLRT